MVKLDQSYILSSLKNTIPNPLRIMRLKRKEGDDNIMLTIISKLKRSTVVDIFEMDMTALRYLQCRSEEEKLCV